MGMFNVKDMYGYTNTHQMPLLSNLNVEWWSEYVNNYTEFDNVFKNQYKSFRFFDQELDDELPNVTASFIKAVKDWLLLNSKRFDELWRVNIVNDADYSIIDNYDIKEEYSGNETNQLATKEGKRTDVDDLKVGNQNSSSLNKVTAFNSNNENSRDSNSSAIGTRNDIDSFTKGEQTNISNHNMQDSHTLRKHGNIGVMTQTDVMNKHTEYWKVYNFYMIIFEEINNQFLLV